MAEKLKPIGVCDHCAGPIPAGQWYTSHGSPRLHCSLECRQTANSRNGNPVRMAKAIGRIKAGLWKNPAKLRPPTSEEQSQRARKGRLREVSQGTWRNPALTDEAREKLSRPRKHDGVLHSAIEKLGRGLSVAELTPDEQAIHREYQRQLRAARRDEINRLARERYRRKKERTHQ